MALSGNLNTGNYTYTQPNVNANSVGGQTVNGVNNVGGYQMPDISSVAATQNQNSQNFNTAQNNQVGAFTGAYNSAAQAMPTYQQLNQQANEQYNVEPLARNAANLQSTLLQVPQTYSQATQGSDTNNNQLMQLIGQKQWELSPQANAATMEAQAAQGLANNMVGYGVQNEQQLLSPYANTVGLQQGLLSGQYANFTQQQSDQLQALTQLAQSGATLSGDQLSQLASLQNAKTQADALISAQKISSQNQLIGQGVTYYNPTTGQAYNPFATPAKPS